MKRIIAILAAIMIGASFSTTVLAEPSVGAEQSTVSAESKAEDSALPTDPAALSAGDFVSCHVDSVGMTIELPQELYILTPDMDEKDPALTAMETTKEEVVKLYEETGVVLRAYAKDYSLEVLITLQSSERTKAIGNLTTLSEEELQKLTDNLMKQEGIKGCSKSTFNGVLYLTLDAEVSGGGLTAYAVEEYTVLKDTNIVIQYQKNGQKLSEADLALMDRIMKSVTYAGVQTVPAVADVGTTAMDKLDVRYWVVLVSSLVAVAVLAAIIIVAIKRHQTVLDEQLEEEERERKEAQQEQQRQEQENRRKQDGQQEAEQAAKSIYSSSLFTPSDETLLYQDKKLEQERRRKEETRSIPRLDATTELEIPENPYTPVGKAEAVVQPALSVTSEFTKMTLASQKTESENTPPVPAAAAESDTEVVFAESAPKMKTEIEQIGESVLTGKLEVEEPASTEDEQPAEKPLSEYEKRFGRSRSTSPETASPLVPVNGEERRASKFERHFGKPTPAAMPITPETNGMAAVESLFGEQLERANLTSAPTSSESAAADTPDALREQTVLQEEVQEKMAGQAAFFESLLHKKEENAPATSAEETSFLSDPSALPEKAPVIRGSMLILEKTEEEEVSRSEEAEQHSQLPEPDTAEPENSASEPDTTETETTESEPDTTETEPTESEPDTTATETTESEPETTETNPTDSEPDTTETKPTDSEPETIETESTDSEPETTEAKPTESEPETTETEPTDSEPETTEPETTESEPETTEAEPTDSEPDTTATETTESEPDTTETKPTDSEPETTAVESTESEPDTTETDPTESEPDTTATETTESEPDTTEAEPTDSEPDTTEAKPTESEPETTETEPTESEPDTTETEPTESEPETTEVEPTESEPDTTEAKPTDSEPETAEAEEPDETQTREFSFPQKPSLAEPAERKPERPVSVPQEPVEKPAKHGLFDVFRKFFIWDKNGDMYISDPQTAQPEPEPVPEEATPEDLKNNSFLQLPTGTPTEIYRADTTPAETPDRPAVPAEPQFELAITKDSDGTVHIDSIIDQSGRSVPVSIEQAPSVSHATSSAPAETTEAAPASENAPSAPAEETGSRFDTLFGGAAKPEAPAPSDTPETTEAASASENTSSAPAEETGSRFDTLFGGAAKPEAPAPSDTPETTEAAPASENTPSAPAEETGSRFDTLFGGTAKPEAPALSDTPETTEAAPDNTPSAPAEETGSRFDTLFGGAAKPEPPKPPAPAAEEPSAEAEAPLSEYEKRFGRRSRPTIEPAAASLPTAGAAEAVAVAGAVSGVAAALSGGSVSDSLLTPLTAADWTQQKPTADTPAEKPLPPEIPDVPEAPAVSEETAQPSPLHPMDPEPSEPEAVPDVPEVPEEPEYLFWKEAGIQFEVAPAPENGWQPKADALTVIPRLESVNADEYKKQYQALRTPPPPPEPEPQPQPTPAPADSQFGFYTGYEEDNTADPFAPGSGQWPPVEEEKPVGFGEKLKRRFGKIFGSSNEEP